MDARRRPDERRNLRTAKTCGPGAPWLVPSAQGDDLCATVTKKVMDTGESAEQAVNTNRAGKAGLIRLNLW